MNLNDELKLVNEYKGGNIYINEPGVFIVEVIGYKVSEEDKTYKGNPYIAFNLSDPDGRTKEVTFYRLTGAESEKAKEFKLKRLKEFLTNANYDESLEGEEQIKSVLGNKIKALFKKKEYIGKDKENYYKPVIKTIIEYSFSKKEEETLKGDQSYFYSKLNDKKQEQFDSLLKAWEQENKPVTQAKTSEDESDEGLNAPNDNIDLEENKDGLPF